MAVTIHISICSLILIAFAKGQHAYQRAAITLGIGTHLVFLSSSAADNYQAINTLAPGKVARIKPSNEMQAHSGQRPKAFGKGNIIHLNLNFHILFNRKRRWLMHFIFIEKCAHFNALYFHNERAEQLCPQCIRPGPRWGS